MSFTFQSTELNATNIINRIGNFNTKIIKFKVGESYVMCVYAEGVRIQVSCTTCIKRTRSFVTFRNEKTSELIKKKIRKRKHTNFLDKNTTECEICDWTTTPFYIQRTTISPVTYYENHLTVVPFRTATN